MPKTPIITAQENLSLIRNSTNLPLVVDFGAPWCAPCQQLDPVIDALAKHFDGQIQFVKVNVGNNPATAADHKIRQIPTLLIFDKKRQQVEKLHNIKPAYEHLKELLQSLPLR